MVTNSTKLRYKCFESSSDFENWQDFVVASGKVLRISSVTPLISHATTLEGSESHTHTMDEVQVFVVYALYDNQE